jgi:mycothiol synthase
VLRAFQPGDEGAIWEIMLRSLERGDLPGQTLHDIETVRDRLSIDPDSRIVCVADGRVVGFVIPPVQQLIVHPEHRRLGYGTLLTEAALAYARAQGWPRLDLAVPPGSDGAEAFARSVGLTYHSSLWQLRLAPIVAVPPPVFPDSVVTRTLQPGVDDERLVDLINTSFAEHPSPLSVTLDALRHVHALPEFDPSGFLLVFPTGDLDRPVAFCRTSMHDGSGEVHLIGVLPEWRGAGLGRALLYWGVHHLRERGATEITLSVEAMNERALGLYERAGFRRVLEWPRWSRPV